MRNVKSATRSQKLAGEVQMARIRLARAESEFKSSEEEWRRARRRRKEAKRAARRAKKHFKLAKAGFAEARQFLADTRARLLKAGERAAAVSRLLGRQTRRRVAKKLRAMATARPGKKASRPPRVRRGQSAVAGVSVTGARKAEASSRRPLRSKPAPRTPPSVPLAAEENRRPIQVPRDFEILPAAAALTKTGRTASASPQF